MAWKDWFYFTKKEKVGVISLLLFTLIVFAARFFISPQQEIEAEPVVVVSQEDNVKQTEEHQNSPQPSVAPKQTYSLFYFDPNTADSAAFVRLGLRPYIAKNIIKYRSKGGKFRMPEDFSRIYGLTPQKMEELRPYIRIAEPPAIPKQSSAATATFPKQESKSIGDTIALASPTNASHQTIVRQEKYPLGTKVDINTADTTELKKIPRIGTSFAKRIVKYREILGGYHTVAQLKEVYGITPEMYDAILPWMMIEDEKVNQLPVNQLSIERLRAHPYLNFYQAKAIVELRQRKGKLSGMSDLQLLEEFSDADFQRLTPYLSFAR